MFKQSLIRYYDEIVNATKILNCLSQKLYVTVVRKHLKSSGSTYAALFFGRISVKTTKSETALKSVHVNISTGRKKRCRYM